MSRTEKQQQEDRDKKTALHSKPSMGWILTGKLDKEETLNLFLHYNHCNDNPYYKDPQRCRNTVQYHRRPNGSKTFYPPDLVSTLKGIRTCNIQKLEILYREHGIHATYNPIFDSRAPVN